jgi:hypothetical protein
MVDVGNQTEIRISRTLPEVEALRDTWMAWPGHRDSDIDVFLMIVQSLPEVVRPHVITLCRDGKPDSILVGRLEDRHLPFRVGYLSLLRPRVRSLTFVYGAIHGNTSTENTEILLRAVMDSLKHKEADVAMFEFVPLDTPLYQLALNVPNIISRDTLPAVQLHDTLTIPTNINEIYQRMSRERRKHIKANIRKIEALPTGPVSIVCYRKRSEFSDLFRDGEEIAKKTYQRGLGVGFSDDPTVRKRLGLGADKGWLRAYILYVGNRPCAFWIGMLYNGSFVSEYMGYDAEFRQYSPGMVLIMRVLEEFCSGATGDTVKELDFGLGHAEYKSVLCSKTWEEAIVFIFSPTARGLILKLLRTATRFLDAAARGVLASTDLLPPLKKAWRDSVALGRRRPDVRTEERQIKSRGEA